MNFYDEPLDEVAGSVDIPIPEGGRLDVQTLRKWWPYEGKFYFRAQVMPKDGQYVWFDLTDDAFVPLRDGVAIIRALPLFTIQQSEEPALVPAQHEAWKRQKIQQLGAAPAASSRAAASPVPDEGQEVDPEAIFAAAESTPEGGEDGVWQEEDGGEGGSWSDAQYDDGADGSYNESGPGSSSNQRLDEAAAQVAQAATAAKEAATAAVSAASTALKGMFNKISQGGDGSGGSGGGGGLFGRLKGLASAAGGGGGGGSSRGGRDREQVPDGSPMPAPAPSSGGARDPFAE